MLVSCLILYINCVIKLFQFFVLNHIFFVTSALLMLHDLVHVICSDTMLNPNLASYLLIGFFKCIFQSTENMYLLVCRHFLTLLFNVALFSLFKMAHHFGLLLWLQLWPAVCGKNGLAGYLFVRYCHHFRLKKNLVYFYRSMYFAAEISSTSRRSNSLSFW